MNFNHNQQVLVATNNPGKYVEISKLLTAINLKPHSVIESKVIEPDEDGVSFAENALIKAKYYAKNFNMQSISDDSGLCILDLENRPGIHSARYAINANGKKDFNFAFNKIAVELQQKGIDFHNKPRAFFICNLCFYNPQNDFFINFEGRVDGFLTFPARGKNGFGYDPIFVKDGMNLSFGEMDSNLKDSISHRNLAFTQFKKWIENL